MARYINQSMSSLSAPTISTAMKATLQTPVNQTCPHYYICPVCGLCYRCYNCYCALDD